MGDALGNIIPFVSAAVSEPSKAVFIKDRVPLMVGLSALAIENIFYALSVTLFIFAGTATLLLTFSLPKGLRYASIGALVTTLLILPLAYLIIRRQARFLSGALGYLGDRGVARKFVGKLTPACAVSRRSRVRILRDEPSQFYFDLCPRHVLSHLRAFWRVFITLSFISPIAPTLTQAFILESVNRIINMAFKFIPLRAGVDEGGTGQVSKVLGFAKGVGETLAIVRKGRDIFWSRDRAFIDLEKRPRIIRLNP